jgi:predicted acylesterase/phospholipase RssA
MPNTKTLTPIFYGGASLAVFQAGVVYELIRLVQFSHGAGAPAGVPRLAVDVIAGTSSGGAAALQLAAGVAGGDIDGVLAQMLEIWLVQADLQRLFPAPGERADALLTDRVNRQVLAELLRRAAADRHAPLQADLACWLSLTNMTGLKEPVSIPQPARDGAPRQVCTFPTLRHGEHERITAADLRDPARHAAVIDAFQASAGYPLAFPPVVRPSSLLADDSTERFVYADGGILDNQPITVALDAIAERPVADRHLILVDPGTQWEEPDFGANRPQAAAGAPRTDPWWVLSQVGPVARTDSVYLDLLRLRRQQRLTAALLPTPREILDNAELRRALVGIQRRLRPGLPEAALALWDQVEPALGAGPNHDRVRTLWSDFATLERFPLRARLGERRFLHGEPPREQAPALAEHWRAYDAAEAALAALDRDCAEVRHRLLRRNLCAGGCAGLDAECIAAVTELLTRLVAAKDGLEAARDALLRRLLLADPAAPMPAQDKPGQAPSPDEQDPIARFLDYARAMQAIEAMSGNAFTPQLTTYRITPFDIYAPTAHRRHLKPLAGGNFGSFGGFLSRRWRINDFLVGRLSARAHLFQRDLLPAAARDDYLTWLQQADAAVPLPSALDAAERALMEGFRAHPPDPDGFADDQTKPPYLLDPDAMDPERLPAAELAATLRGLLRSARRLGRAHRGMAYRVVGLAAVPLAIAELALRIAEVTLRHFGPERREPSAIPRRLRSPNRRP